jgi:hypothetical protein
MPSGQYKRKPRKTANNAPEQNAVPVTRKYRVDVSNHWDEPLVVFLEVPASNPREAIERVKSNGLRFTAEPSEK